MGFRQLRVRDHGTLARVELIPADMERLLDPRLRESVVGACKNSGYTYVTLDLQGYRTGTMNEAVVRESSTRAKFCNVCRYALAADFAMIQSIRGR